MHRISLSVIFCAVVSFTVIPSALVLCQDSLIIPITISDAAGHFLTMRFGVHSMASYGFDEWLDEVPLPPYPPVPVFDVRFLDPQRRKQFAGDGAYVDIRQFISTAQADTFALRFQPSEDAFPLTFAWDREQTLRCDSIVVIPIGESGPFRVDMKSSSTFHVFSPDFTTALIVMKGPHPSGVTDDHATGGK
jgi:hypothetical protein